MENRLRGAVSKEDCYELKKICKTERCGTARTNRTIQGAGNQLKALRLARCNQWGDWLPGLYGYGIRDEFTLFGNTSFGGWLLLSGRPFAEKSGITGTGTAGRLL